MLRALSVVLCLMIPGAAFADGPAVDQPTPAALTPQDAAQPQPAVEQARWCGAHGGCSGRGAGKWIVLTGVTATVLTAVAVGVAVGVASHNRANGSVSP
jgi:hypothetical protein